MGNFELVALIVAVTELGKGLGLPSKFCPLFAVLFSLGMSVAQQYFPEGIYGMLIEGLVYGLIATGLYKATDEKLFSRLK